MHFANPAALALALPLGAALVWLHMRHRVPERTHRFYAAFLTPAEPLRQQLSPRVRQPVLLALRLALLLALVGMLAEPYRESELAGAQSAQWVLVDASLSMHLAADPLQPDRSRFDEAMDRARQYARQGAELRQCGADLAIPGSGAEHGRMNLERCVAAARSSYAGRIVVLTDGQGAEIPRGDDPLLRYDYVGTQTVVAGSDARDWQPLQLERGDEGLQLARNLRRDGPLELALRQGSESMADKDLSRCEAQRRCVLGEAGSQAWLQVRLPQGPLGIQESDAGRVLAEAVDWAVPLLDPALTITVVASVTERGLYSGRQILLEALDALAAANPRYSVTLARDPAELRGRRGFIVFLWDSLDSDAWTQALVGRDPGSVLWVIPSRALPDTLVPRELVFGFGTYRGWLDAPSTVKPSDVLPGAASTQRVDWQYSTAAVFRRLSIAETGSAETVLTDMQGTPLLLWSGAPAHTLLFTTGLDAGLSEWALTPDFVPMLSALLSHYTPSDQSSDRCVAARNLPDGRMCPGRAGRWPAADGTVQYVLPDFSDLAAVSWRVVPSATAEGTTQHEPLGAWLAAAAVGVMVLTWLAPAAWLGAALLLLSPGSVRAQDVVDMVESEALRQSVFTLPGVVPDQGRQDAFRRLSVELDRRANIALRGPEAPMGGVPSGALVWLQLCRSTEAGLNASLAQAVEALRQGAVLWVEDCAAPDEISPAFRALTQALRVARIASNWEPVGSRHVIFKSYYLLSRIEGRQLSGGEKVIASDGMPLVLYTPQDVTGKVAYDGLTETRVRGFVNILFYLLMGDYKEDGIHVPYLLERLHRTRR